MGLFVTKPLNEKITRAKAASSRSLRNQQSNSTHPTHTARVTASITQATGPIKYDTTAPETKRKSAPSPMMANSATTLRI